MQDYDKFIRREFLCPVNMIVVLASAMDVDLMYSRDRSGFSLEGIITCAENINGRIVDHAIYALNRSRWQNPVA